MYLKKLHNNISFLLVDDDALMLETLAKDLRKMEFKGVFQHACNGEEAIEMLAKHDIDFIICDYYMPEISGIEFLKYVRENKDYKEMPFIMLTSNNDIEQVNEVIEEGVSNYLIKPWTEEQLTKKIKSSWARSYKLDI